MNTTNPWKGLDFYKESEVLYGRDVEIESLFDYIRHNTQVVLYGRSGIGKSSIINAGIFPKVRVEGWIPVPIKLSHDNRMSYVDQIREAIHRNHVDMYEVVPAISDKESLWEFFHRHQFFDSQGVRVNLLIVFDQFEEIFTLQPIENVRLEFFAEMADLFNDTTPRSIVEARKATPRKRQESENGQFDRSRENEIDIDIDFNQADDNRTFEKDYLSESCAHFLFAIREDFLSYLERYTAHIPVMRNNRFSLLPLNEEQAAEIIMKPYPGLVSTEVAKMIIAKVTGTTQFELDNVPELEVDSAVLSLYLSRLFEEMVSTQATSFTKQLVEHAGSDIIRRFYKEGIAPLSSDKQERLEYLLLTGDNRRDNISRSDFLAEGFTNEDVEYLVEKAKLLRQFFMRNDLRLEFIHDVLCEVVKESKETRTLQRQQEEERKRQEEEKRKLQEEAERKQRQIMEKNRKWLLCLSSIIIFILLCFGSYYYGYIIPYSEDYSHFTTKNGWPQGQGELLRSPQDKKIGHLYYRLTREGRFNRFRGKERPFTTVQIIQWTGDSATNELIESPVVRAIDKELSDVKAAEFAKLLSEVSYWRYTPDTKGSLSVKTAFDIHGKELYSEKYSSSNTMDTTSKYVMWCVMSDKDGKAFQISDNGIDRIRYTISDGYITGCSFFTVLGTPQPNTSGDYGYSFVIDSTGVDIVARYELDKFGDRTENYVDTRKDSIHLSPAGYVDYVCQYVNDSEYILLRYESKDLLSEKKRYVNQTLISSERYFYSDRLDSIRKMDVNGVPQSYVEKYAYTTLDRTEISFWDKKGNKIMLLYLNRGDTIYCHKIIKDISYQSAERTEITSFYDCDDRLTSQGLYAKSMIISDSKSGNTLFEYYYDNQDEICKSEMFTYNEYGIRESRAVAGIDRTPVRCPNWDWDGFAYYKMSFIKDFYNLLFIAIIGNNEFGDECYIVKQDSLFTINDIPLSCIINSSQGSKTFSIGLSKNNYELLGNQIRVPFLHILNKSSVLYTAVGQQDYVERDGLYDNDILYQIGKWTLGDDMNRLSKEWLSLGTHGGQIKILRCVDREYRLLTFAVEQGELRAEYHLLPLTEKETQNIKNIQL